MELCKCICQNSAKKAENSSRRSQREYRVPSHVSTTSVPDSAGSVNFSSDCREAAELARQCGVHHRVTVCKISAEVMRKIDADELQAWIDPDYSPLAPFAP
jgi:hypothetical protein